LVDGHPTLLAIADALLLARAILGEQLNKLQKRLVSLARDDKRARLLMSTPGVGVLVALTYVAAIDGPARFKSSKAAGAHFGLTPKKYQSGETDVTGRISKIGDASVRKARGTICHEKPLRSLHQPHWLSRPPFSMIAFQ
jgi:transposase